MVLTIIVFILILSALVLVHEAGHFMTARNRGVKVEEFGFGFPPKLFSIKRGETEYSINAIPIGGFVKLYGEDGQVAPQTPPSLPSVRGGGDDKTVLPSPDLSAEASAKAERELEGEGDTRRAFFKKKVWERSAIIVAGVVMNAILAVFLLGVGHWIGLPTIVDDSNRDAAKDRMIQVVQVVSGSPAAKAGIKIGDSLETLQLTTNNQQQAKIIDVKGVQDFIEMNKGNEIVVGVSRGDESLDINLVPRVDPPEGEGAIGIAMSEVGFVSYPWYVAIWKGIESTFLMIMMMLSFVFGLIKTLIIGTPSPIGAGDVSGPVGIVVLTHQVTQLGLVYILQFAAIISINLAILNILPFPALDGGRMLFLIIEKIKGSPVNQKLEGMVHQIGFLILILFMIFITFRDVVKLF